MSTRFSPRKKLFHTCVVACGGLSTERLLAIYRDRARFTVLMRAAALRYLASRKFGHLTFGHRKAAAKQFYRDLTLP